VKIPYALAWLSGQMSTAWSDWVTHEPPAVAIEAVKMSRRFMYFDSSKASRELGYAPRPLEDALRDAVNWFANNGFFELNPSNKEPLCRFQ
jgi:dihydroflavonol-4-reductase